MRLLAIASLWTCTGQCDGGRNNANLVMGDQLGKSADGATLLVDVDAVVDGEL
jgi:hypothetical protein